MQIVYKIVKSAHHEGFGYEMNDEEVIITRNAKMNPIPKGKAYFSCRTRESDGGVIYLWEEGMGRIEFSEDQCVV